MALISRERAGELGRETVRILREGGYRSPSGAWMDLRPALERSVRDTVEYPPEFVVTDTCDRGVPQSARVENASVLVVGRGLAALGPVTILNFASGTQPGGGFQAGARAQEETIARSSGLYACIKDRRMYPLPPAHISLTGNKRRCYHRGRRMSVAGERLAIRVARLERTVDEGFQATNRQFEDLRSEMNGRFEQVDRRFEQIDGRFDQIDRRFVQVDERFAGLRQELRTHMDVIAERLESRIQVLAEGMQAFLDRLDGHERRLQAVEHQTESLDLRVTALETRKDTRG